MWRCTFTLPPFSPMWPENNRLVFISFFAPFDLKYFVLKYSILLLAAGDSSTICNDVAPLSLHISHGVLNAENRTKVYCTTMTLTGIFYFEPFVSCSGWLPSSSTGILIKSNSIFKITFGYNTLIECIIFYLCLLKLFILSFTERKFHSLRHNWQPVLSLLCANVIQIL